MNPDIILQNIKTGVYPEGFGVGTLIGEHGPMGMKHVIDRLCEVTGITISEELYEKALNSAYDVSQVNILSRDTKVLRVELGIMGKDEELCVILKCELDDAQAKTLLTDWLEHQQTLYDAYCNPIW